MSERAYELAKQKFIQAEIELEYAKKQLERERQSNFIKLLLNKLYVEAPKKYYRKYIEQITSFDISHTYEFTIRFGNKFVTGKTKDQQIYVEINYMRYVLNQIDILGPEYISDMEPFLNWLYTVKIDGKQIEPIIRDALIKLKVI